MTEPDPDPPKDSTPTPIYKGYMPLLKVQIPKYRVCTVFRCTNSSEFLKDKTFIPVPIDEPRRMEWFFASQVVPQKLDAGVFFVCEDHFDFEKDLENYEEWKTKGARPQMKFDVLPHIFRHLEDPNAPPSQTNQDPSVDEDLQGITSIRVPPQLLRQILLKAGMSQKLKSHVKQNSSSAGTSKPHKCKKKSHMKQGSSLSGTSEPQKLNQPPGVGQVSSSSGIPSSSSSIPSTSEPCKYFPPQYLGGGFTLTATLPRKLRELPHMKKYASLPGPFLRRITQLPSTPCCRRPPMSQTPSSSQVPSTAGPQMRQISSCIPCNCHCRSYAPCMTSNIPCMPSNAPSSASNGSCMTPNAPYMAPNAPYMASNAPCTAPNPPCMTLNAPYIPSNPPPCIYSHISPCDYRPTLTQSLPRVPITGVSRKFVHKIRRKLRLGIPTPYRLVYRPYVPPNLPGIPCPVPPNTKQNLSHKFKRQQHTNKDSPSTSATLKRKKSHSAEESVSRQISKIVGTASTSGYKERKKAHQQSQEFSSKSTHRSKDPINIKKPIYKSKGTQMPPETNRFKKRSHLKISKRKVPQSSTVQSPKQEPKAEDHTDTNA